MGIALKGDFIGFWIDDIHSSELGIIRTSDGSRFNENLLPTIQDKTVQVPGGDGFYYFGSYYTQRPFNISIAFDNMGEAQFRRLKQIIGSKKIVRLVFDETPYKYYSVKSTGTPTLKYICFDVGVDDQGGSVSDVYAQTPAAETKRVYKGEGTLNFVAYDPFGYARATGLDSLVLPNGDQIANQNEWLFKITDTTGEYQYPLPNKQQTNAFMSGSEIQLKPFYNCGDLPCDYKIFCNLQPKKDGSGKTYYDNLIIADWQYEENNEEMIQNCEILLILDTSKITDGNTKFCFDSKTGMVYSWKNTGHASNKEIIYEKIYNDCLIAAKFGRMPVGGQSLWTFNVSEAPDIKANFKYF